MQETTRPIPIWVLWQMLERERQLGRAEPIVLDSESFDSFTATMANPPPPNAALRALFTDEERAWFKGPARESP